MEYLEDTEDDRIIMSSVDISVLWSDSMSPTPHINLTHKQLETHECIISTVATAALELKHQVISNQSANYIMFTAIDQSHTKMLHSKRTK